MTASGYRMYSKSSRDSQYELIERYAPLVKRIAYHLLARLPASVQVDGVVARFPVLEELEVAATRAAAEVGQYGRVDVVREVGAFLADSNSRRAKALPVHRAAHCRR